MSNNNFEADIQLFSQKLKELRKKCKLTQANIAEYLGMNTNSYQKYELGTREPSIKNILKLCNLLHVSADELLGIEAIYRVELLDRIAKLEKESHEEAKLLMKILREKAQSLNLDLLALLIEMETKL